MLANTELPDGTWEIQTHSDKVCTELSKLGYEPVSSVVDDGVTLWRFVLPSKDVIKQTPELLKATIEASLDLSLVVKRFTSPIWVVGDGKDNFGALGDKPEDAAVVFSKDPEFLKNEGNDPAVAELTTWSSMRDILKTAKSNGIKYVLRFITKTNAEKYNLDLVLFAAETFAKKETLN